MRQIILAVFAFLVIFPMTSQGQEVRVTMRVDWERVREAAEKKPQYIKELVSRLSANEIDTTMTWNERILAYYGQSFLTPNTELSEGVELDKLRNEKKYEECLAKAKDVLQTNPVSLKALYNAVISITMMLKDTTGHHEVSREEGQVYFHRMSRILNTIAKTGDGTEEKPFYVTAVSDEYIFMNFYLEIGDTGKQYMTDRFDVFELKETSKYYSNPKIYFDITRVLEIERGLFENK